MLRVICPNCEKTIGIPHATANAVVACPACRQRFRIPNPTVTALEPEPPPPSPTPPAQFTDAELQPSGSQAGDSPRRRRRRRRFGSSDRAGLVSTGKNLVILFACLLGAIEIADLVLTLVHHPSADEMLGDQPEGLAAQLKNGMHDEPKIDIKEVAKSVGSLIFIGALTAGLCAGKNGARIGLAVILFIRTGVQFCCGALGMGFLSAVGIKLSAFLPELILLGFVIAIYPTVAVTLLASKSIKAYCDG